MIIKTSIESKQCSMKISYGVYIFPFNAPAWKIIKKIKINLLSLLHYFITCKNNELNFV